MVIHSVTLSTNIMDTIYVSLNGKISAVILFVSIGTFHARLLAVLWPKATFTLLRFSFYPFLSMKTLPVHIAPFSNRYAMKTIGVHIAPAKRCC